MTAGARGTGAIEIDAECVALGGTTVIPDLVPVGTCLRSEVRTDWLSFDRAMLIVLGVMAMLDICLAPVVDYRIGWWANLSSAWSLPSIILAGWYCGRAGHSRLAEIFSTIRWTLVLGILIGPLVEIAARTPFPLVDRNLALVDSYLIQTVNVVRWLQRVPGLNGLSGVIYGLVAPVLFGAPLLVPTLSKRGVDTRRYIFAVTISLLITMGVFAFLPAAGPWTVEAYRPSAEQARAAADLVALKLHTSGQSGLPSEGIVSFPSFHTILAVLAATALWNVRPIRWLAFGAGVAVCLSTVTSGWHYLIDVAAGIVVAFCCHALACRTIRE